MTVRLSANLEAHGQSEESAHTVTLLGFSSPASVTNCYLLISVIFSTNPLEEGI